MLLDDYEKLTAAAKGLLNAYTDASLSDEEGLLANVDPAAMRALWVKTDEAAEKLREALHDEPEPGL